MRRPRALIAVTVYNGRSFVPACVDSLARLDRSSCDVDAVVLDDASPDPGWGEELAARCDRAGIGYYRSPSNIGIVRNVNLGLGLALEGAYDYVAISNSDVVYPPNLVTQLVRVLAADSSIGSATAWSNDASIYSIPADKDFVSSPANVAWLSETLASEFGVETLDVPTAISFFVMMPVAAVRRVGLMDPIFGRGYCEEIDWSVRSRRLGYRTVLAPGVFVYHAGRGSTVDAGLLGEGETTVPLNEAIIDSRYPRYRREVSIFRWRRGIERLLARAGRALVSRAGQAEGYVVHVGEPPAPEPARAECVLVGRRARLSLRCSYAGFRLDVSARRGSAIAKLVELFGKPPVEVLVHDRWGAEELIRHFEEAGVDVRDGERYDRAR